MIAEVSSVFHKYRKSKNLTDCKPLTFSTFIQRFTSDELLKIESFLIESNCLSKSKTPFTETCTKIIKILRKHVLFDNSDLPYGGINYFNV